MAAPILPVDLGTPGAISGAAIDVNDAGVVVGSIRNAAGATTTVRWFPDGRQDTVPLATAVGIANDGSVAGQLSTCVVARWKPANTGPVTGVATAPPFAGANCMRALAMSPNGSAIAGAADVQYGAPLFTLQNPFNWTPTPFPPGYVTNLGGIVPWRYGVAYGVNGSATTVGSLMRTPPDFTQQAFVASMLGPIVLIGRAGIPGSRALAINSAGVIVGVQDGGAARLFAVPCCGVEPLMPGVASSAAVAINDKGEIVIDAGTQAYLLRGATLVPLAAPGGTTAYAAAVNERSQVVGWAYDAQGVQRPVLWDVDALVAVAGGPYASVEGAPLHFAGGATGAGETATYAWSFGDGGTATGASPMHAYADEGSYTVTLTVTDGARQATARTLASVANAMPTIAVAPGGIIYSGETFTVRARFDDAGVSDAPWRWWLLDQDSTLLGSGEATIAPDSIRVAVTPLRAGTYWLSLNLVDTDGGGTGGLVRLDVLRLPVSMHVAPASLRAAQQGNGLLTVIVFATPGVDPARIDVASVRLGGGLAPAARGNGQPMAALADVNRDGAMELVLKFRRSDVRDALTGAGGALVLQADLVDGRQVEGRWRWPAPATGT